MVKSCCPSRGTFVQVCHSIFTFTLFNVHFSHSVQELYLQDLTWPYPGQGALCTPHLNHSISSKRLGFWSYGLVNFRFMYCRFGKVQFHQSALIYVAMATIQLFGLFLKTWIAIVFQVFPHKRNFLWDKLLCFGHPKTLESLIIANVRTVTIKTFQKIIFAQIWSSTLKQLINAIFHSL